jgi:peptidyl-prolyl cis-trans isomerase D
MAVLETIRVKFGILITVLIAVALLSFIIDPSTLQSVSSSMSSKYDVGEIDGKSISYNDYQADVDRFTTINEILTGGSAQNEQQQISIRNAAWQSLVDKYLFVKNAEKAGIHVGEEELLSMISGDLESPVFTQNPAFFDENGNFSKNMVLEFVSYMNSDQTGRLPIYWNWLQESAKTQQYYAKYNSLFTASNFANTLAVANQIAENNNTFNVEFVMLPLGYGQDSTIVVSDSEIKKYYEAHKKFYRQQASRDIEYVVFEVVPSAEDIAAANQALVDVYDEFAAAENMKTFLLANSDRQYDNHWYKAGELNTVAKVVNDYAFGKNAGVSEVLTN